ncbi:hypothetical protein C8F01DRAFT_1226698 [Mycena amicta]|nr:hypothetical protein C8F01DRAFT_1226698 [Mycena amicta]
MSTQKFKCVRFDVPQKYRPLGEDAYDYESASEENSPVFGPPKLDSGGGNAKSLGDYVEDDNDSSELKGGKPTTGPTDHRRFLASSEPHFKSSSAQAAQRHTNNFIESITEAWHEEWEGLWKEGSSLNRRRGGIPMTLQKAAGSVHVEPPAVSASAKRSTCWDRHWQWQLSSRAPVPSPITSESSSSSSSAFLADREASRKRAHEQLKAELRQELKAELRHELKDELRAELTEEILALVEDRISERVRAAFAPRG